MSTGSFDINEVKRRMQGAIQSLKHELGGLRTGRARHEDRRCGHRRHRRCDEMTFCALQQSTVGHPAHPLIVPVLDRGACVFSRYVISADDHCPHYHGGIRGCRDVVDRPGATDVAHESLGA